MIALIFVGGAVELFALSMVMRQARRRRTTVPTSPALPLLVLSFAGVVIIAVGVSTLFA